MSTAEKAQDLFDKGLSSLEEGNCNEALHYFNESIKIQPNQKAEDKIKECKEKIKEKKEKESINPESTTESCTPDKNEEEIECESIINEKDYYKLLNVIKENIDADGLKKAYKKLAIKFHPDKNKSLRAEEAFKKISTVYQTLNDTKKRNLYDKYGTEEEFREKYYQANQQRYEEEDEYDIYDVLFNDQPRRRRNQYQQATPEQQRKMRYLSILQFLFFLIFILYQYLSILFAKKPLYAFERNIEFAITKKTTRNKVPYYTNDIFAIQFPNQMVREEEEKNIETAYLDYSNQKCNERKELKNQYEYKLWYVYKGSSQYDYYIEKLKQLDFSICDIHTKLKNKLEIGFGGEVFKEEDVEQVNEEEKEDETNDENENENDNDDDINSEDKTKETSKDSTEDNNEEEDDLFS